MPKITIEVFVDGISTEKFAEIMRDRFVVRDIEDRIDYAVEGSIRGAWSDLDDLGFQENKDVAARAYINPETGD